MVRPKEVRETPYPPRVAALPRDKRGYPIPFVAMVDGDGVPHFAVLDEAKRLRCMKERLCGICGDPLEWWIFFVGGERSVKNRIFADPPMHEECARYSLSVCPFLARDVAKYRPVEKAPPTMTNAVGDEVKVVTDNDGQTKRPPHMALYKTRKFDIVRLRDRSALQLNWRAAAPKGIEWFPPLSEAGEARDHSPTENDSVPSEPSHEARPVVPA